MIIHSPESGHAKELAKWETRPTAEVTEDMLRAVTAAGQHMGHGFHGYGAPVFQEYPKMMYQAIRRQTGGPAIQYPGTPAQSAVEEANLASRGFRTDQNEAIKVITDADMTAAEAAAERAYQDRRMSPKAQDEALKIDRAVARHLGEIPVVPIKRRRPWQKKTKAEPSST